MSKNFDFVAIGDVVTDAFIRLKEAEVHCSINHEKCEICLPFATKIPYESVTVVPAVGNSPNAAVAAARLGLQTALITNIGEDDNGQEILTALKQERIDTTFVTSHAGQKTNYHYVLWYSDDRTILIKHEDYPYTLPDFGIPKWLYLSSLGEHAASYHQAIADYLTAHPEIKLAFQPGTFQMKMGTSQLATIYARTEIFFCNTDEAKRILQITTNERANDADKVRDLLTGIQKLGPKIVVITDGPKGAYALADGATYFMPPYPDPKAPLERTGAGDAFSATVTAALALGQDLETALRWGPINSMSVVQEIGAQKGLLGRQKLEEYLQNAAADYLPKKI